MQLNPAQCLVKAFGGVRPAARILKRSPGSVGRWVKNGTVPTSIQKTALRKAVLNGYDLTANDLIYGRKIKR